MNRDHIGGLWQILLGIAQEIGGALCGRAHYRHRGFERRVAGKAQMAIADAQRLLDACRRDADPHSFPVPARPDLSRATEPDDAAHLVGSA